MDEPTTIKLMPANLSDIRQIKFKNKHLLVRLYPQQEETDSGLVLTESAQDKRLAAWILGVADDIDDPDFKVGHTITAGAYALETPAGEVDGLPLDKTPLRILKAHEVVSVIPPLADEEV